MPDAVSRREALEELAKRRARVDLLGFMRWCWWMPHQLVVGRHTRAVADRLTRAVNDWRDGKTTYLLIAIPFRHGKSDIVSRALPAWFLGRNADRQPDVIQSGYGFSLVTGFSKWVKRIMTESAYQELFPGVVPARGTNKADSWAVEGSSGQVTAQGLGGSLTGKGGHLLIVDDYCKNREEAASKTYRDKIWDGFRNDLLTRQNAPASIVVVCATPWHVDDLRGRIKREMAANADFPQFEEVNFPATRPGDYETLFPERFNMAWYKAQRAALGKQAAALLDCEPMVEGGNRFATDRVKIHETLDGWPAGRETRGWDLASSSKERDSDDPDRTWGVRGHIRTVNIGQGAVQREIWVRSMVACREEAPKRDALIRSTAQADGMAVPQHVEAFGGYKDAFTTLKAVLSGVCVVRASRLPGDKSAKLAGLEPSFDGALVHLYGPGCRPWLDTWLTEFAGFPDSGHDDGPDATAVMYHSQVSTAGSHFLGG